jgi:hypothetical protein
MLARTVQHHGRPACPAQSGQRSGQRLQEHGIAKVISIQIYNEKRLTHETSDALDEIRDAR